MALPPEGSAGRLRPLCAHNTPPLLAQDAKQVTPFTGMVLINERNAQLFKEGHSEFGAISTAKTMDVLMVWYLYRKR